MKMVNIPTSLVQQEVLEDCKSSLDGPILV